MTRKGFLSALVAVAAAPFIKKEQPINELPKDRPITPQDVEHFVRMEVKGKDLYAVIQDYDYKYHNKTR